MNIQYTLLAATITAILATPTIAQETLPTSVATSEQEIAVENKKTLTPEQIDNQLINDINDTVRYLPGVDVNNTGNRFGDNGFNIRGMEGDAVAITLDGLSQGESLNPLTYSRYGMYSSTRNAIEVESVKQIEIVKGANSVVAGSGALGGAVMYTTKDASDFLPVTGDSSAGKIKLSYDGRNQEKAATVSVANRSGNLESLVIYTTRNGSEFNTHDDGDDVTGAARGQADPYDNQKTNLLLKFGYHLTPAHKLKLVYEDYNSENTGTPLSRDSSTYFDFHTNDESNRERLGVIYNWQAHSLMFDELEAQYNKQEIYTTGVTAFSYSSGSSSYLRTEDRNFKQDMDNISLDFVKFVQSGELSHDINYGVTSQRTDVVNHLQDIRYNGLTPDTGLRDGYPIIDPSWVPKTETTTSTLYFRDTVALSQALALTAGIRYDTTEYKPQTDGTFEDSANVVQNADFSAVTGQLSADYQLMKGHHIIASVGTGFKAPSTQQLYLNTNLSSEYQDVSKAVDPTTGAVSYVPNGRTEQDLNAITNPDLEAEEGINYELSYQWENKDSRLRVSAFRSDYKNMILNINQTREFDQPLTSVSFNGRDPACQSASFPESCWIVSQVTGDDYTVPTNSGEIEVSGFEIDGAWHLTRQLTATLAYSHTEGKYKNSPDLADNYVESSYKKGDPLESISPDTTVIGLNYHSPDNLWGLSSIARFTETKKQQDSFSATYYSDAATVVDLTAWVHFTEDLTFRASITNLFNEKYLQWQRIRYVREGTGGFFGGVAGNGIDRYSEPGRQLSAQVTYSF